MNRSHSSQTLQNQLLPNVKLYFGILSSTLLLAFLFFANSGQAQSLNTFFNHTDDFLHKYVKDGKVDYHRIASDNSFDELVNEIAITDLSQANDKEKQSFYINAYNLLVIKGVVNDYPLKSVLEVNGFFKHSKYLVAGEKVTLEQIEQIKLIKAYGDPRFHFVLVCGAIGCPPITNFAYQPEKLEEQLTQQTRMAINNPVFIRLNEEMGSLELSSIFNWYQKDFGGSPKSVIEFINDYRTTAVAKDLKVSYYDYDWSLNAGMLDAKPSTLDSNEPDRYIASAPISSGNTETKIFSGIYTQQLNEESRSTFFTSNLSFLYGIKPGLNIGFDLRYRRVTNGAFADSPLAVFGNGTPGQSRSGITNIGPKVRWAPKTRWPNFSVQSSFGIPVGKNLEGDATRPYIDWDGPTSWTQVFNDFPIGTKFSVFAEIDLLLEDIGFNKERNFNRLSTPVTSILSYYPTSRITIYGLANFSPFLTPTFDYFAQGGIGAKYNFSDAVGIEALYTKFTNGFLRQNNGQASTINFGIRLSK